MHHLNLVAVYAADTTGLIGQDNAIPWHIPEDMLYFKDLTMYHTVVMGRKTLESIGKRLPGRKIAVISSDPTYTHTGTQTSPSPA